MPNGVKSKPRNKDNVNMNTEAEYNQETHQRTHESTAYLEGLFSELREQKQKYNRLTGDLLALEARIELAEKTLCLTRDHFAMTLANTQDALPHDWATVLEGVKYAGIRLADACASSVQKHGKMTPEQLLRDLNQGMFRFRTNSPLREIHAALLRHPHVKRSSGYYVWVAPPEAEQIPMRLRVVQREMVTPATEALEGKENEKDIAS
jgi:hypothetical protein